MWARIETAPKDGTLIHVLTDCASVWVTHLACYRGLDEWEAYGKYRDEDETFEDYEGWWSYTDNSVSQTKLEGYKLPQFWMPFVEPDTAKDIT